MTPTAQQKKIIDAPGNLIIVANPGSGKTFVLAEKIKNILPDTVEIKGVIAISYTNKASHELKSRCLKDGLAPKGSFFGTMDKFYLSEIVVPFAKQLFGIPKVEIDIVRRSDLEESTKEELNWLDDKIDLDNLPQKHIDLLKKLFLQGRIVLESVGLFSIYVFNKSKACRKYIKSRYTHIIIDEYQDTGKEQHLLFLKIKELGLTAIAVGDTNQSIFKFSGKSSDYLIDLAKQKDGFTLFPLDFNHRCDASIINYSLLLLNKNSDLLPCDNIHVFEKQVQGNEVQIAQWLSKAIIQYTNRYKVNKESKVGVLVRNGRTGTIIHNNIGLPHKYFEATPLDEDFTIWSGLFRDLLSIIFDKAQSRTTFVENYISTDINRTKVISILKQIKELGEKFASPNFDLLSIADLSERIATNLHPSGRNSKSIILLKEVLSDARLLESYKPAADNEIQIMSLHKSKGLEFDIVFHLDLYEWILPKKELKDNKGFFSDLVQDINLHYVGITRAKKCCVLCYSNRRTNHKFENKPGNPSEFLKVEYLQKKRNPSPF
ncbi:ATP-dependent helicase [Chitinophaga sp.]|uniref:ATP-dependent helicase n=1 Tax=Chitinophaga sp. TaxID=1869181 RepID=UPI0031D83412